MKFRTFTALYINTIEIGCKKVHHRLVKVGWLVVVSEVRTWKHWTWDTRERSKRRKKRLVGWSEEPGESDESGHVWCAGSGSV